MSGKYIVESLKEKIPNAVVGLITFLDLLRYLEEDPYPNYRLVNVQSLAGSNYLLVWEEKDDGWQALLDAVKMAYRKHVDDDPDIGWSTLSEKLGEALSQAMGSEAFGQWVDEVRK